MPATPSAITTRLPSHRLVACIPPRRMRLATCKAITETLQMSFAELQWLRERPQSSWCTQFGENLEIRHPTDRFSSWFRFRGGRPGVTGGAPVASERPDTVILMFAHGWRSAHPEAQPARVRDRLVALLRGDVREVVTHNELVQWERGDWENAAMPIGRHIGAHESDGSDGWHGSSSTPVRRYRQLLCASMPCSSRSDLLA